MSKYNEPRERLGIQGLVRVLERDGWKRVDPAGKKRSPPEPLDALHVHTEHGERVVVSCPGGETDPLHPDDAEAWALEILAAVNRARDVAS